MSEWEGKIKRDFYLLRDLDKDFVGENTYFSWIYHHLERIRKTEAKLKVFLCFSGWSVYLFSSLFCSMATYWRCFRSFSWKFWTFYVSLNFFDRWRKVEIDLYGIFGEFLPGKSKRIERKWKYLKRWNWNEGEVNTLTTSQKDWWSWAKR